MGVPILTHNNLDTDTHGRTRGEARGLFTSVELYNIMHTTY